MIILFSFNLFLLYSFIVLCWMTSLLFCSVFPSPPFFIWDSRSLWLSLSRCFRSLSLFFSRSLSLSFSLCFFEAPNWNQGKDENQTEVSLPWCLNIGGHDVTSALSDQALEFGNLAFISTVSCNQRRHFQDVTQSWRSWSKIFSLAEKNKETFILLKVRGKHS